MDRSLARTDCFGREGLWVIEDVHSFGVDYDAL